MSRWEDLYQNDISRAKWPCPAPIRVKELGFKDKEVRIKECKMANNPEYSILWIETEIDQVKNIFMKAVITGNRKI